MSKSFFALTGSIIVASLVAGCAHAQASTKTTAGMPPLDVPAPPPRAVEPAIAGVPQPGGLVSEPARNIPPATRQPASPPPKTDAPRVDTQPVEPPKIADEPAKTQPPATLKTTPAEQEGEVEARIHTVLSRATGDLNRVDYMRLNPNAKSQYESAKRFVSLAEDALRARNLVYAGTLAGKAADLAAQLAGR